MVPSKTRLKLTDAFSAIYRRGRWAHGPTLSVGALPNAQTATRIGLRTRRGLKGAVVRNRLKRQLRAIVCSRAIPLRSGLDLVIVIHPRTLRVRSDRLKGELLALCKKTGLLP